MTKYMVHFRIAEKIDYVSYRYQNFFRQLYGWTQRQYKKVDGKTKIYNYKRKGILTPNNHIKLGKSCFVIHERSLNKLLRFIKEYPLEVKVTYEKVDIKELGGNPLKVVDEYISKRKAINDESML